MTESTKPHSIRLEVLAPEFSVCKLGPHSAVPAELTDLPYCFISRTPS